MFTLILLIILTLGSGILLYVLVENDYEGVAVLVGILSCILCIILVFCLVAAICTAISSPLTVVEYQEKYEILMRRIEQVNSGDLTIEDRITLFDQICEYNKGVRSAQAIRSNLWTNVFAPNLDECKLIPYDILD